MSKYNRKVILDYINGNEIVDYDIEELEDDYEFMIEIMNYTNDKNMYNLCSDKVKNNYDFVKFVVNKFRNDLNFICQIADNFLQNVKDELIEMEFVIIMRNLTENKDTEYIRKYEVLSNATFSTKMVEIELIRAQYKEDEEVVNEIQTGFWFIIDRYSCSDIITKFYAQKFIDVIISENNINIEVLLHERFNKYEDLEKNGINNYLIEFINSYDSYLSNYVSCNLDVLKNIKEQMNKAKLRWNFYNSTNEAKKYNAIINGVHEYMQEYGEHCSFEEMEILYYIGNELGIGEKIYKYSYEYVSYEEIVDNFTIEKSMMNFNDLRHYYAIKKLIINIITSGSVNKSEDSEESKNTNRKPKAKILKIDFNKKN